MKKITIVDARMGRGKSSAAIRYMNENKGKKKFLYITPFLSEVSRVCEYCEFDQPNDTDSTKLTDLKRHISMGHNIAFTHELFRILDNKALELIRKSEYDLIIDESISLVEKVQLCCEDVEILLNHFVDRDENGRLSWKDKQYIGVFLEFKKMADAGFLYVSSGKVLKMIRPSILNSFNDVYMLTYLFNGQYQKAYLDFFGFKYRIIGVKEDDKGFYFSYEPDCPPPIDYRKLINIVSKDKMNRIGNDRHDLSKNWYARRGQNHPDIKRLRNNMFTFFRNSDKDERVWTSFKSSVGKLTAGNGRYKSNFLQISARATNDYRNKTYVAYLGNRFADPNIKNFFLSKNIRIDEDMFALSEMLQWIWRSAIRDEKPINLYIPSKRMRDLLENWMAEQNYENAEEYEYDDEDIDGVDTEMSIIDFNKK